MMHWRTGTLQHVHEYVQNQIALGDAKAAGILAWDAALVALIAGTGAQPDDFGVLSLLLLLAVGSMILSVIFCAIALAPNVPQAGSSNRVSFVDTACCSVEEYSSGMRDATEEQLEPEMCEHIHLLAGIAKKKYDRIGWAILLSTLASALLILALLL